MPISLIKRLVKGSKLTFAEVDNNWQLIEDAINAMATPGAANYKTLTVTFTAGIENGVLHAINKKARFVTFFRSDGYPIDFSWRRDPTDELNVILIDIPAETPSTELIDVEVNVQAS